MLNEDGLTVLKGVNDLNELETAAHALLLEPTLSAVRGVTKRDKLSWRQINAGKMEHEYEITLSHPTTGRQYALLRNTPLEQAVTRHSFQRNSL